MTVYLFWIIIISLMLVAVVIVRRIDVDPKVRILFSILATTVFEVSTIVNVRFFILQSWVGNSDAFAGFSIVQTLINPARFVLGQFPASLILGPSPVDAIVDSNTMHVTYVLWQAMLQDFIIGAAFWFLATHGILRLIAKGAKNA